MFIIILTQSFCLETKHHFHIMNFGKTMRIIRIGIYIHIVLTGMTSVQRSRSRLLYRSAIRIIALGQEPCLSHGRIIYSIIGFQVRCPSLDRFNDKSTLHIKLIILGNISSTLVQLHDLLKESTENIAVGIAERSGRPAVHAQIIIKRTAQRRRSVVIFTDKSRIYIQSHPFGQLRIKFSRHGVTFQFIGRHVTKSGLIQIIGRCIVSDLIRTATYTHVVFLRERPIFIHNIIPVRICRIVIPLIRPILGVTGIRYHIHRTFLSIHRCINTVHHLLLEIISASCISTGLIIIIGKRPRIYHIRNTRRTTPAEVIIVSNRSLSLTSLLRSNKNYPIWCT